VPRGFCRRVEPVSYLSPSRAVRRGNPAQRRVRDAPSAGGYRTIRRRAVVRGVSVTQRTGAIHGLKARRGIDAARLWRVHHLPVPRHRRRPHPTPTYRLTSTSGCAGTTYKLLDGVGPTVQTKVVDSSAGPQSYTSTQYTPCACSPMGMLQATSQPVAIANGSPWVRYSGMAHFDTLIWPT